MSEESEVEKEVEESEEKGWNGFAIWLVLLLVVSVVLYCVAGAAVSGLTVITGISCLLRGGS